MKKNNTMISFKLPSELKVKLERLADKDGRTLSNMIVRILTVYTEGNT